MTGIKPVDRVEELDKLDELLDETDDRSLVVSVIAPLGTGKSTFLEMVRQDFDTDSVTCLNETMLAVDIPESFFRRFFSRLESQIHPTKSKIKEFMSAHQKRIQLALDAISAVPGMPNIDFLGEHLPGQRQDRLNSMLEAELLKIIQEFANKFPDQKLLIQIDDLDVCLQKEIFVGIFKDIRKNLPPNVMLVFSAVKDIVDSDRLIPLLNFGAKEITEFVDENLSKIANVENVVSQILDKSGGYPDALAWLWQNYRKGEDIRALLSRLPREGFLQKLQKNFLQLLSEHEQTILKTCGTLLSFDPRIVSSMTNIEFSTVTNILNDFARNSVAITLNYNQLRTGQIVDFYVIHPTFRKLVETVYGQEPELHRKAVNYYAKSLLDEIYPIQTAVVGWLLQAYSSSLPSGKSISVADLFKSLSLDPVEKSRLCPMIVNYFLITENKKLAEESINIMPVIAESLANDMFKNLYLSLYRIYKNDLEGKPADSIAELQKLVTSMEAVASGIANEEKKQQMIYTAKLFKAIALESSKEESSMDTLGRSLEAVGLKEFVELFRNKLFLSYCMLQLGESYLAVNNHEVGIAALLEAKKFLHSKTSDDKTVFQLDPDSLALGIDYDLGIGYLIKVGQLIQSGGYDRTELRNLTKDSLELLAKFKKDPVKGQYYDYASRLLEELESEDDADHP